MTSLALVGDIGGTNARFALVDPSAPQIELQASKSLANADFASLQHAIEHYLAGVAMKPERAALAVACPVGSDEIRLTNLAWTFSRAGLQHALGLSELRLLNDFGAVAHAVPALQCGDYVALHGDPDAPLQGPVSVLGPGTGLGVALLVGDDARGWQAIETEGGHVGFAPIGDEELAIHAWLQRRHGRVSTERLLSGRGLSEIDAVLRGAAIEAPLRDPATIVAAALAGSDPHAQQVLARFCAVLGSVAGDCALSHGARSVVIAGGIAPRFVPFLRASAFRERFLAKGRMAPLLESLPVRLITHPHPGLLGAACALRAPEP